MSNKIRRSRKGIRLQCRNCGRERWSANMYYIQTRVCDVHYCGAKKCKALFDASVKSHKDYDKTHRTWLDP